MRHVTFSGHWFLAALVLCCSICGVARADNTIAFYTGSWETIGFGPGWSPGDTTVGSDVLYESSSLEFVFNFSAPITNLQQTGNCDPFCSYTGNVDSGTVSFDGADNSGQNPPYDFTGYILPGGTFSAQESCDPIGCSWDDNITFDFRSQSSNNGWSSTGELQFTGGCDSGECESIGPLSLHTYATPEPSSLILFGSSAFGLAGLFRVKRRRQLQ
jgi:hypothetical protein